MQDSARRGSKEPSEPKAQTLRSRMTSLIDLFTTTEVVGAVANFFVVAWRELKSKMHKDDGGGSGRISASRPFRQNKKPLVR